MTGIISITLIAIGVLIIYKDISYCIITLSQMLQQAILLIFSIICKLVQAKSVHR